MAIKIVLNANVKVYEDEAKKNCLFDLSTTSTELNISSMGESNSGKMVLAASGVVSVPFGTVAAGKGVFLKSDQDLDITLNGGSDVHEARKHAVSTTTVPTFVPFLFMGNVTSVSVTNASATEAANITFVVFGDPV